MKKEKKSTYHESRTEIPKLSKLEKVGLILPIILFFLCVIGAYCAAAGLFH